VDIVDAGDIDEEHRVETGGSITLARCS
jgi:hypothetical protein